ncbi:MAG: hypothetical protein IKZ65_03620, partial [Lachnospiraceae bacterium]|nr:hypothetical protein [Lachnospiraceae bacterium]
ASFCHLLSIEGGKFSLVLVFEVVDRLFNLVFISEDSSAGRKQVIFCGTVTAVLSFLIIYLLAAFETYGFLNIF